MSPTVTLPETETSVEAVMTKKPVRTGPSPSAWACDGVAHGPDLVFHCQPKPDIA